MNQIETNISKNIKELRVASGMKQSELGEKIAYSDKTISKWENGSSVPDIVALGAVADLFGITVDDLIRENAADKLINREKKPSSNQSNDIVMLCLSVLSVFTIAVTVYVAFFIIKKVVFWQVFVWAIPVSAYLCAKYNKAHGNIKWVNTVLFSLICWGLIVAAYLQILSYNLWPIFFIGAPLEAMIIVSTLFSKTSTFISLSIFKSPDDSKHKKDGKG